MRCPSPHQGKGRGSGQHHPHRVKDQIETFVASWEATTVGERIGDGPHMAWHRFTPASEDDHQCTWPACELIVSDDALDDIAVECPAPPCTDPTNDGACVMVAAEDSVVCAYCGASGAPKWS